jgi:HEAT repeat protein
MKMKKTLIAVLVLAVSSGWLIAARKAPGPGSGEDLKPLVSSILERFPAKTSAARDGLCAEILKLGPAAVREICGRVLASEAGDDSKARFAVNGLAIYVTRPGAESERALFARALLASVAGSRDKNVAAFLLSQIQAAGKKESIRPLAGYLADETLAGPAAAALRTIGGPEAARALLKSLDAAPPAARSAIIKSLGELRSREAVKKILRYAESAEEGLRRTALFALANIGDPAAGPILSKSRVAASFRERAQAPSLYLLFARRLVEAGRTAQGLDAARAVVDSYVRPEESHLAAEALALIVSALGERALPDLLRAMDSPHHDYRGAALALTSSIPGIGATARWVERAAQCGPDVRAEVTEMLGRRGDASALPFVRESLLSRDKLVRLAAIPAAARLGGEAVFPDLLRLVGTADEDEAAALRTALLGYRAGLVVLECVRILESTPLPGKAILIEVLGEKGAREEIDRVFALAQDPEKAVRSAAVGALANLAGEKDLPRLVSMLETAIDGDDILRLQEAVASAVRRNPDPMKRADALLELLKNAPPTRKIAILRVLPKVGGTRPLQAAVEEYGSADAQVQSVAVYALSQWPDHQAADELLRIAKTTRTKKHLLLAVDGYVRLIGRANMSNPKKLELLQGLLALPMDDADRKTVLTGVASVREPESLRLLSGYLANPTLRETAAAGLLDLASEQDPHERWLSGHEAYTVLRRVEAILAGPAEKERVDKVIVERLRQGGFVPLFDGHGLGGWKGLVADPPGRAKMTPAELAKAQAEADDRMRAHWKVADGVLVFDGKGESLCALGDYADFELLVDWKIENGGDSGLYLRGSPQVQIWDAGANPAGSGGLYNNQKGRSLPLEKADRPVGEWNAFRIFMIGDKVSVYLNDRLVVDNTALENYWERDKPIYPSGQVELQAHGNPLFFRNIFIREIPRDTDVPGIAEAETAEGFAPLFNGRDLGGWVGDTKGYAAENGKIVIHPELGSGNLYSAKDYADLVLRFEFKLTPAANNGLGIRAPLEGDAAYAGMELQILEDGSPVYWGLKPYQYHGSIYGAVPARRGALRPVGEWNTEEVTVKGRHVTVIVNGTTIVDADIDAASAGGTVDGHDHPGLKRETGRIGFLGHGSIVEFRNIRLKEL